MNEFVKGMLSSQSGTVSSSRTLAWAVTLTIITVWAWVSVSSRSLVDLPNGVLGLVALAIGGYGVGKALESKGDTNG